MYNCYNEAVRYLQDKYGTTIVVTGSPFYFRGKAPKQGTTTTFKNVECDDDDNEIKLLIKQYHFGIAPQKELYFKLVYMGIMEDKENKC